MAKIAQLHSIHLSILLCSSLFFVLALSTERNGFSLELIPIKSDHSPLYKSNISDPEIVKLLAQFDRFGKSEINLTDKGSLPMALIPYRKYLVPFTIGIEAAKRTYNLIFDTGNRLTWTQCHLCHRCFDQSVPIYNPSESRTFYEVKCNEPLCRPPLFYCINGKCEYHRTFLNGVFYRGDLSKEVVTFGTYLTIPNVTFGCTRDSRVDFPVNTIHGVMSMDMSPTSFLTQTRVLSQGVFSYCLVPSVNTGSWLRFGTHIIHPGQYQTTSIIRYPDHLYYVSVLDISINGQRLGLAPGTFDRHPNGDGGFRIDTGFPAGRLIASAHARVAAYLEGYFRGFNIPIVNDPSGVYSPCFGITPENQRLLPALALIFPNGAHFDIQSQRLFFINRENMMCFSFRPDREQSVLGNFEQANTWMKFDTNHNEWSFAPQDCARQS
ncbi:hypothetical protein LUZ60_013983 [Juncus effusus]|nr:hypothetical protein LUZ60_013983 [Juncus effusus]